MHSEDRTLSYDRQNNSLHAFDERITLYVVDAAQHKTRLSGVQARTACSSAEHTKKERSWRIARIRTQNVKIHNLFWHCQF
jgi:hypothetical protein